MSQMNLDYDPADLPMDVTPGREEVRAELSRQHFPSLFDDILADVPYPDVPPAIRLQPPVLKPITFRCIEAVGSGGGFAPADVPYYLPPAARIAAGRDDSSARKAAPLATGCLDYFPDALWAVAELSFLGNEKHNPGEPLHDARGKSGDDADALLRHLKDRGRWDSLRLADGSDARVRHSAAVAWRALRLLQREIEADGAERARAAKD